MRAGPTRLTSRGHRAPAHRETERYLRCPDMRALPHDAQVERKRKRQATSDREPFDRRDGDRLDRLPGRAEPLSRAGDAATLQHRHLCGEGPWRDRRGRGRRKIRSRPASSPRRRRPSRSLSRFRATSVNSSIAWSERALRGLPRSKVTIATRPCLRTDTKSWVIDSRPPGGGCRRYPWNRYRGFGENSPVRGDAAPDSSPAPTGRVRRCGVETCIPSPSRT